MARDAGVLADRFPGRRLEGEAQELMGGTMGPIGPIGPIEGG